MKKTILLSVITLCLTALSYGQIPQSQSNLGTIEKKVTEMVQETSKTVSISSYQQKAVIKTLIKVEQEYQRIENSNQGASQKTEAFAALEKKKEYSLKSILNTQQYAMLIAFIEQEKNEKEH